MPSTRSSSMPNVWLSSTVMTPSVPTFSSDSAIIAPTSLSAAEMAATLAICAWSVLTLLLSFLIDSTAASTAFSMPPFSTMVLKGGIEKAVDAAVESIKKDSKSVKTDHAQIANVAAISAADKEVGAMIAESLEKVGTDGVITVEESQTFGMELDLV